MKKTTCAVAAIVLAACFAPDTIELNFTKAKLATKKQRTIDASPSLNVAELLILCCLHRESYRARLHSHVKYLF